MLKIGVIGAGIISKSHLDAAMHIEGVEITCIIDIVLEKAERFSADYGVRAYTDYKEMIKREQLDAVIIALPHGLHRDVAIDCCNHRLHVLIEKPMAVSKEECEEMIEAADRNGVKLMIAHPQRYFPENIKAKEIIELGELGQLMMIVDIRNNNYFTEARPGWFLNKSMAGGGIFMNYGAHSIDKIKWLTGSKVKQSVGKAGFFKENCEVEGNAQAFLELENGVTAVLSQSGHKGDIRNVTELYFSEGTLRLCTGEGLWINKGKGYEKIMLDSEKRVFEDQLEDFLNCIEKNTKPEIPGEYGEEIISCIENLYKH